MIHRKLDMSKFKRDWPPTPQDLMQNDMLYNCDLFNFIAWIVDPNAPLGNEGLVKLSKTKELKVIQVAQNIESLLPHSQPSLDQALLSLVLHRKTGSSDVIDTIHKLGYGISYTETLFIEDKWAE